MTAILKRLTALALLPALLICLGAAPAPARLTPDGYGPVRVGMTLKQAQAALGVTFETPSDDFENCFEVGPVGNHPGVIFLFEDGRMRRASSTDDPMVRTVAGIHVGSSLADVRRAYGKALIREAAPYNDKPAHDLYLWRSKTRGLRFEIDEHGRVATVHGGSEAIRYSEGCA